MNIGRRDFIVMAETPAPLTIGCAVWKGEQKMYGLIGKMVAAADQHLLLNQLPADCWRLEAAHSG